MLIDSYIVTDKYLGDIPFFTLKTAKKWVADHKGASLKEVKYTYVRI